MPLRLLELGKPIVQESDGAAVGCLAFCEGLVRSREKAACRRVPAERHETSRKARFKFDDSGMDDRKCVLVRGEGGTVERSRLPVPTLFRQDHGQVISRHGSSRMILAETALAEIYDCAHSLDRPVYAFASRKRVALGVRRSLQRGSQPDSDGKRSGEPRATAAPCNLHDQARRTGRRRHSDKAKHSDKANASGLGRRVSGASTSRILRCNRPGGRSGRLTFRLAGPGARRPTTESSSSTVEPKSLNAKVQRCSTTTFRCRSAPSCGWSYTEWRRRSASTNRRPQSSGKRFGHIWPIPSTFYPQVRNSYHIFLPLSPIP